MQRNESQSSQAPHLLKWLLGSHTVCKLQHDGFPPASPLAHYLGLQDAISKFKQNCIVHNTMALGYGMDGTSEPSSGPYICSGILGWGSPKRWFCASLFVITQSRWGAKIKNVVPQILGTCCFCGNDTQCKCGVKPKENETSQCSWEMMEVWDYVNALNN